MNDPTTIYRLHADVCKALASPVRIRIIDLLQEEEMSAGELADELGVTKGNLSQHLNLMKDKGIVTARREGAHIYYSVSNKKVVKACRLMREVLMERLSENVGLIKQMEKR
jgi:ArsR family transcriptional regulator